MTTPNPDQPERCPSIDPHGELQCGRRIHEDDRCQFGGIGWKKGTPRYVSDHERLEAIMEARAEGRERIVGVELHCDDCQRPYGVWFADDEVWNLVIGGPDAKGDPGGMLCPRCFTVRAESVYQRTAIWRLVLDNAALPPAASECPSRCGRNDPCPDPWHDRRVLPPGEGRA